MNSGEGCRWRTVFETDSPETAGPTTGFVVTADFKTADFKTAGMFTYPFTKEARGIGEVLLADGRPAGSPCMRTYLMT
jgi:hypothetical protein